MSNYEAAVDAAEPTKVNINATCEHCGTRSFSRVDTEKFLRWWKGELIQNVWPELSDSERELIKTGTHPGCWDELMKEL